MPKESRKNSRNLRTRPVAPLQEHVFLSERVCDQF